MQRRRPVQLAIAALSAAAVLAGTALSANAAEAQTKRSVGPKVAKVTVSGQKVTVRGTVALRRNTSFARRAARVTLTLTNNAGKAERKVVKLNRKRAFVASRTTRLSGSLTVAVSVKVAGKRLGKQARRKVTVRAPAKKGLANGPLVGTFRIDPGSTGAGQPSGSYFQMVQANGQPLGNFTSTSANKEVTPLRPGTDGGLRTDVFQAPPTPAFAGGAVGGALAGRIIAPTPFFGVDFSVVTAPTDPQTATPDPLPEIVNSGGQLSGQITAWVAQWNGESFNQGTPKPDGSTPAPTSGLSGTVNPTTGRYTLEWRSRIVGGPFNGFAGRWHLEGQFVPAAP